MTSGTAGERADRRELWIGLAGAVLLLAVWTAFFFIARIGLRTDFAPADLVALRVGIGGLVVLPWFVRFGFGRLKLARGVPLALLAGIGFAAFAFWAPTFAPLSHAGALQTGALPLYTGVLAMLVLGERFGAVKLAGLALIVAGIVLMGYESLAVGAPGQWRGDLLYSSASFTWAVYTVLVQRWRVRILQAMVSVYVLSAVLYLPVYVLFFDSRLLTAPIGSLVIQGLLQGVISPVLSLWLFMRVVQSLGGTSATMLTAATPGVVTLLSIPLLGEIPSPLAWAGVACVTLGIIATVASLRGRQLDADAPLAEAAPGDAAWPAKSAK